MGTNVKQDAYLKLAKSGQQLTDEKAKQLIYEEFGFDISRIEIVREVSTYEVNKNFRTRKAETYQREPYYEATDWYYIRFNVRGSVTWQWEATDGMLREYCC